jgi:2-aminoadipate transaminase
LRDLIAGEHGADSNEVFISNGSIQILDLLAGCLLQPGSLVITEQPTYDRTIATFRRHGARVVGVPLEADGLNVERLEKLIRREGRPAALYLIPDFQNPTGSMMSLAKRRAVLELADRYDFPVIEDMPYRRLRYQGKELPRLRDLNSGRVITMSSYTKLISPGMRVGFSIADAGLTRQLVQLAEATYLSPVLLTQAMVYEYVRRGYLDPHIRELVELYRPRWQAAVDACRKYLPEAGLTAPDGGFFVGIMLPESARVDGLLERAGKVRLGLTAGASFFADADDSGATAGDRFVRLPFCALEPAEIEEGVRRLAGLL